MELVGTTLAERYRITSVLGTGGMGRVFAGVQQSLDRPVAVKVLRDGKSSGVKGRFEREAKLLSRLAHPNIVAVYDYGETDEGEPYVVMERVDGHDLRHALQARGPFDVTEAMRVLAQVCAALAEAHRASVAHFDLKPENIMLANKPDGSEVVKVLDFGIARIVDGDDVTDATMTNTGAILGTPAYISPEQIKGVRTDVRSDLYALGIIAYELLTGRLPFDASAPGELVVHHLMSTPKPIAQAHPGAKVPPALEAWVMRLLSKEASARPKDGAAALASLEDALGAGASHASHASHASSPLALPVPAASLPLVALMTPSTSAPSTSSRRTALVAAAAACGAGAVAWVAWWAQRRSPAAARARLVNAAMLVFTPRNASAGDQEAARALVNELWVNPPGKVEGIRWQHIHGVLAQLGIASDAILDENQQTEICRRLPDASMSIAAELFVSRKATAPFEVTFIVLDTAQSTYLHDSRFTAKTAKEVLEKANALVDEWARSDDGRAWLAAESARLASAPIVKENKR